MQSVLMTVTFSELWVRSNMEEPFQTTPCGITLIEGQEPLTTFTFTLKMYPRKDIDWREFQRLVKDIDRNINGDGRPWYFKEPQHTVQFDIARLTTDTRGFKWKKILFMYVPSFHLMSAPSEGYTVEFSLQDCIYLGPRDYNTIWYHDDIPLSFFLKIADAMDKHKIFLDTSML